MGCGASKSTEAVVSEPTEASSQAANGSADRAMTPHAASAEKNDTTASRPSTSSTFHEATAASSEGGSGSEGNGGTSADGVDAADTVSEDGGGLNDAEEDDEFKILASYLPEDLVATICDTATDEFCFVPRRAVHGALLLIDVSGFTAMSEVFAEKGVAGAESLSNTMNAYFSSFIQIINLYGASVEKFAGDAMLVFFPAATEEAIACCSLRAALCADHVRSALAEFPIPGTSIVLGFHAGIVNGKFYVLQIDDEEDVARRLLTGYPLLEMAEVLGSTGRGEVTASSAVKTVLESFHLPMHEAPDSAAAVFHLDPIPDVTRAEILRDAPSYRGSKWNLQSTNIAAAKRGIRRFIDPFVLQKIDLHQEQFLSEMRYMTVLFVSIKEGIPLSKSDCASAASYKIDVGRVSEIIKAIQSEVAAQSGSILNCLVDEKGFNVIVGFGYPVTHQRDDVRGVRFALRLQSLMKCSIGISVGRTFCGNVGASASRQEFTAISDVVNTAARLAYMQPAGIFVDARIFEKCRYLFEFEDLDVTQIKGKNKSLHVFRAICENAHSTSENSAMEHGPDEMEALVQRQSLVDAFCPGFQRHSTLAGRSTVNGSFFVLSGPAGSGKSTFVRNAGNFARNEQITVFFNDLLSADESRDSHKYAPFASLFWHFCGSKHSSSMDGLLAVLRDVFDEDDMNMLDVFNPFLSLMNFEFMPSKRSRLLDAFARLENLSRMFHKLIVSVNSKFGASILVIFENAHNLDHVSQRMLAEFAVRPAAGVIFLLSSTDKTFSDLFPSVDDSNAPSVKQVHIGGFTHAELAQFIRNQYPGSMSVSSAVVDFVSERSFLGLPLHAFLVTSLLKKQQFLEVTDGSVLFSAKTRVSADEMEELLQAGWANDSLALANVVLDRLDADSALVARIAAVVAEYMNDFHVCFLMMVSRYMISESNYEKAIVRLEAAGILRSHASEVVGEPARLQFASQQVQKALVMSLVPSFRAEAHYQAALAVEERSASMCERASRDGSSMRVDEMKREFLTVLLAHCHAYVTGRLSFVQHDTSSESSSHSGVGSTLSTRASTHVGLGHRTSSTFSDTHFEKFVSQSLEKSWSLFRLIPVKEYKKREVLLRRIWGYVELLEEAFNQDIRSEKLRVSIEMTSVLLKIMFAAGDETAEWARRSYELADRTDRSFVRVLANLFAIAVPHNDLPLQRRVVEELEQVCSLYPDDAVIQVQLYHHRLKFKYNVRSSEGVSEDMDAIWKNYLKAPRAVVQSEYEYGGHEGVSCGLASASKSLWFLGHISKAHDACRDSLKPDVSDAGALASLVAVGKTLYVPLLERNTSRILAAESEIKELVAISSDGGRKVVFASLMDGYMSICRVFDAQELPLKRQLFNRFDELYKGFEKVGLVNDALRASYCDALLQLDLDEYAQTARHVVRCIIEASLEGAEVNVCIEDMWIIAAQTVLRTNAQLTIGNQEYSALDCLNKAICIALESGSRVYRAKALHVMLSQVLNLSNDVVSTRKTELEECCSWFVANNRIADLQECGFLWNAILFSGVDTVHQPQ
eukprot:ANDGO_02240.mRNA.1 hypothetical protein PPTG_00491